MRNYKIHLVRHGLTEANIDGRYIGRTDEPLCQQGRAELEYLFANCDYPYVERVYSSPLERCLQTAEILFDGREIKTVNELMEIDLGDFDGKTAEQLKDQDAYKAWTKDALNNPPPNGEATDSFMFRLVGAFKEIIEDMMQSGIFEVAIVTHGGVIMSSLSAMGLPKASMEKWQCPAGAGFTISVSAAMWMRDSAFEITGVLPYGIEKLID